MRVRERHPGTQMPQSVEGDRDFERRRLYEISHRVIGAAQRISTCIGTGFPEKVYENALCLELRGLGFEILQQCPLEVRYRGRVIGEFVPDILIGNSLVIEVKAVAAIVAAHRHQCLSYLRAAGLRVGLVLNFGPSRLEVGRVVNDF